MLISLARLEGYQIRTTEPMGAIQDFLVTDNDWMLRYFVIDTGNWLPGRIVLLSPEAIGEPEFEKRTLPTNLTTEQVENSPPIDRDQPVSRQYEEALVGYYGWTPYWSPPMVAAAPPIPSPPLTPSAPTDTAESSQKGNDPHLRSVKEVQGYQIEAQDGAIGHIDDFIVDTENLPWRIRYFVVDTGEWILGRKVLVASDWITRLNWSQRSAQVEVSREAVRESPEFDPAFPINRELEAQLYDYYGRQVG